MHRTLVKLVIAAFVLALPAIASAQLRSGGQVVGTVKDATGAVLPNAAIVLIDTATGANFEAKSARAAAAEALRVVVDAVEGDVDGAAGATPPGCSRTIRRRSTTRCSCSTGSATAAAA